MRKCPYCSSCIFFSEKHSSKTMQMYENIIHTKQLLYYRTSTTVDCNYRKFVCIRCIWRTHRNSQLMARGNIAYSVQKKFRALINQRSELWRDELTIPVKGPYLRKWLKRSTIRTWKRDIANGREVPPGVKELIEDGVWDPCEFKAIIMHMQPSFTLHSHTVKLGGEDATKEDLLQIVKKELEKLRREHKEETQMKRERENKTRKMLLNDEEEDTEGESGPPDEDRGTYLTLSMTTRWMGV